MKFLLSDTLSEVLSFFAGDMAQVLTILQRLPKLAKLDFTNAYLSGSIPSNLTFPALQTLLLSSNNIIVGDPLIATHETYKSLSLCMVFLCNMLTGSQMMYSSSHTHSNLSALNFQPGSRLANARGTCAAT
jgi:hypothetical protein